MHVEREAEVQVRESDGQILLLHACALSEGSVTEVLSGWRLGESLGFSMQETRALVDHLVEAGHLRYAGEGFLVRITEAGIARAEGRAVRSVVGQG